MSKEQVVYMVFVNKGTLDHPIIFLRPLGEDRYVDDTGDHLCSYLEVDRGLQDKGGRMYLVTSDYDEAESVITGVYMVRKMLREWVDE